MEIVETFVDSTIVSCDGNAGSDNTGHPLVYLKLGSDNKVQCPYCGHSFVIKN